MKARCSKKLKDILNIKPKPIITTKDKYISFKPINKLLEKKSMDRLKRKAGRENFETLNFQNNLKPKVCAKVSNSQKSQKFTPHDIKQGLKKNFKT